MVLAAGALAGVGASGDGAGRVRVALRVRVVCGRGGLVGAGHVWMRVIRQRVRVAYGSRVRWVRRVYGCR